MKNWEIYYLKPIRYWELCYNFILSFLLYMKKAPSSKIEKWKSILQKKPIQEIKKDEAELLRFMKEKNLKLKDIQNIMNDTKLNRPNYASIGEATQSEIIIALCSCKHIWNKHSSMDAIHEWYRIAKEEWAEVVFDSWDITDWNNIYKWHKFESNALSYSDQIAKVVDQHPDILETYVIGWNHDEDWLKQVWADPIEDIARQRPDIHSLWRYNAKIDYKWIPIELQHAWWSQSYAKSYKIQKYLEKIENQPLVYSLWHYHDWIYMIYRWTHAFSNASFQWENLLSKRFWLWNVKWMRIVKMKFGDEWQVNVTPMFIDLSRFKS